MRADQALARLFPEHSRSRLQSWLKSGRITIAGASPDPKTKVWGGETVEVSAEPTEESLAQQAEDIPLAVVFEDDVGELFIWHRGPIEGGSPRGQAGSGIGGGLRAARIRDGLEQKWCRNDQICI